MVLKKQKSEVFDSISNWLIEKKGCQRDEYSYGVIKEVNVEGELFDILGIKYVCNTTKNEIPFFEFHGYLIEVVFNEDDINVSLGKIIRIKDKCNANESHGMHTVRFYIAYTTDKIPEELLRLCGDRGIGVLRVQPGESGVVHIYEAVEPEEIELKNQISNKSQRSIGPFLDAINAVGYLKQMFKRPREMFYKCISPAQEEYNKKHR